jgi:hypothetical protein
MDTILLTNNNNNINFIEYFLDSLTTLQILTNSYTINRTLQLSVIDNIESCHGIVKLSNVHINHTPVFEKVENIEFISAIIKDQTFINNLLLFQNDYSNTILDTEVIINNDRYHCNKYIEIADKKYYILNQI